VFFDVRWQWLWSVPVQRAGIGVAQRVLRPGLARKVACAPV